MTQSSIFILFLVLVLAYFAEYFVLFIGVLRALREGAKPQVDSIVGGSLPKVTIIVCARDEELHIGDCLTSLSAIDYPADRFEILIVDDKSTDRTPEILREWQSKLTNLHVLRTGEEIAHLRGKVNALTQGLDAATGEIVLITDADTNVQPPWVKGYVKHYEADTGLVASITLLRVGSFFDAIQSIDWAYLLGMAAAGANMNIPLSVIGNNMSIRKKAYDDVGGYRKIPFSVTEDHALFSAIWNKKPWKVKFPVAHELLVLSEATPDFKSWWRQKHRWVKGGQDLKLIGYLIFGIGLLGNLAMLIALGVLPLGEALTVIGIKWAADLLIILPVLGRTKMLKLLRLFPIYEIYISLFVFSMPVMMMQKKVKWKGRIYQ